MCDFFDLLDTLIDRAIEHQPKVKDFGRRLCETLKGYTFLSKRNAPCWLKDPDLHADRKNAAAAAYVWFVGQVHPVLDTIAKNADAQAVIINALPEPLLPPKPVVKDKRGRRLSASDWDKKFRHDKIFLSAMWATLWADWKRRSQHHAIFLWGVWALWKDLVGYRRSWKLPRSPASQSLIALPQKQREQFLAVIETGMTQMFATDAEGFVGETLSALRWLRAAFTKHARQARDAKADGERFALDYTDGGGIVDISCPPRPKRGAPESECLAWLKRRCKTLQVCFPGPAGHYPNCKREEARDWLAAAYSAACDWLPPATVGECEHLETVDAAERNPSEARAELARLARAATTRLLELHQPGGEDKPPLSEKAAAVLNLLRELPTERALTGEAILNALAERDPLHNMDLSTLTRHIMPILKKHYGVKNKPRIGYYVSR